MEFVYNGKKYERRNSKWVDSDHMVVPAFLQRTLNQLTHSEEDLCEMDYEAAKREGDKLKESESFALAIKYFDRALEKSESLHEASYILPRITACYRKLNMPKKVIETLADAKERWGVVIINEALLTSVAAAYCDLGEPTSAIRCCKWAYRVLKEKMHDQSRELSLVFLRANLMIDPHYRPDDEFEDDL